MDTKVQVCKDAGLQLYDQSLLDQIPTKNRQSDPNDDDHTAVTEAATTMCFICACGNTDYEHHLKSKSLDGEDIYPEILADARDIMDQHVEVGP